jgi:hypothetical protein
MYAFWFKKPKDIHRPIAIDEALSGLFTQPGSEPFPETRPPDFRCVFRRSSNFNGVAHKKRRGPWWISDFLFACVASMCAIYGGIHLLALNFSFPSSTEKLLWRISCIVTVCQSLLAPAFVIWSMWTFQHGFVKAQRHIFNYRKEPSESWARYGFRVFIILGVVTLPLSITARLFLVIESFISLRGVPAGVYATVPWTQYIPHI